jgi:hypothetical protein
MTTIQFPMIIQQENRVYKVIREVGDFPVDELFKIVSASITTPDEIAAILNKKADI